MIETLQIAATAAADARREDLLRWVDPLLFAARTLGLDASPGQVAGAAAWADPRQADQAILEIAGAAGLGAQFADLRVARLSSAMLPALVICDGTQVGVITAVASGQATVLLFIEGKTVERVLPLDGPALGAVARVLLVQARAARRDERVDPPR